MKPTVEDIAAVQDPVLRNLWITQRYHELAEALPETGTGPDATWCTFAVWASKTAGSVIRGDDLPGLIRALVSGPAAGPIDRFNRDVLRLAHLADPLGEEHLARFAEMISADVASDIAAGNLLVFTELAPPFEALANHSQTVLPTGTEGSLLEGAFETYRRALACGPESRDRPVLMLVGNVLAVAHEQQRLQGAIASALDAPVRDTLRQVVDADFADHLPGPARWLVDRVVDELGAIVAPLCRVAVTRTMLRLVTADEDLDLCSDLPALPGGLWPPELAVLGPEAAPYFQWDRTAGRGRPTGAHDWGVVEDRMNYIVNLFRSRQRHRPLLDPPFTASQLNEMRAGRRPSGPL